MGVDWVQIPFGNAGRRKARQLIEQRAFALRQYGGLFIDELNDINPDRLTSPQEREKALKEYVQPGNDLLDLLGLTWDVHIQSLSVMRMRVYPITCNGIFPLEWRLKAYRDFLPEEVPEYLQKWKTYIQAVKNGAYQDYLLPYYLYAESRKITRFREDFLWHIQNMQERDNAWAKRMRDTSIPEQFLSLPKHPLYPCPQWIDSQNRPIDYQNDPRYHQIHKSLKHMHTLRREWNRRVPSKQKISYERYPLETFESYLQWANSEWTQECFAWLRGCIEKGNGLYLWG